MSDINVNVQDSPYVVTNTINKVQIRVMNIDLFKRILTILNFITAIDIINNKIYIINHFYIIYGIHSSSNIEGFLDNSDQSILSLFCSSKGIAFILSDKKGQ